MTAKSVVKKIIFLVSATIAITLFYSAVVVLIQDILILPSIMMGGTGVASEETPPMTTNLAITSTHGRLIHARQYHLNRKLYPFEKGDSNRLLPEIPPILFLHGNGDTLKSVTGFGQLLQLYGLEMYSFEYHGTGDSEGWPSEEVLYQDAASVLEFIADKRNLPHADIILLGFSFGSGIATYLAEQYSTKNLILFAPYLSIKEVTRDRGFAYYLSPLLRWKLPSYQYVQGLRHTCVDVFHGKHDQIIPLRHSIELAKFYRGKCGFNLKVIENTGHDPLSNNLQIELYKAFHRISEQASTN